ncbi:CaiB/BaiF CoA transferase family protein [Kibdelosporangium phytohabitans]|uniref:Carnitine dehydratase n=1 Tax=Kibdelosporangium phytohabitans TaxID=860235 RepID=A0A0N9IDU5_9PSEU|nr:CaiB/BaiF CoA-transferase family protein [Kibdelosporangium phytohabitans]ALG13505.1 carnitine dehydratase [Kibdelosporangium phytohabitans]
MVSTGPLAGVRVVELAGIGPAPFCAMHLADLGADVVRVDRPGLIPVAGPPDRDLLNRNKRSVMVDLKNDRGAEVVLRLAEQAHVLIEGFRPGVAERLGIGPEQCWERNPKLVYGRMTGWGQEGPLAHSAGHDIAYIGITGVLHAIGRADGPPQVPLNLVGDFGGGSLYLAVGVLSALRHAEQTGKGQVVDAAIVDGAAHLATMIYGLASAGVWQPQRGVNLLDTGAPFYDVYETSDGEYMAVGPLEPQFYKEFVRLLGIDGEGGLPTQFEIPRWPELRKRFAEVFATRTRGEWAAVFEGTDACVAPILSLTEAAGHPHIAARGTLVERGGLVQPAPAPRFTETPAQLRTPPALPGQHTRNALADWGFQDIDELLAHGAVQERNET